MPSTPAVQASAGAGSLFRGSVCCNVSGIDQVAPAASGSTGHLAWLALEQAGRAAPAERGARSVSWTVVSGGTVGLRRAGGDSGRGAGLLP